MSDRARWSFVSGEVNALRERLLDRRALLALLQAASVEEQATRLRMSLLFSDAPPGPHPIEEVEARFEGIVARIASHAPDPRVADLLLMGRRWEAHRASARTRFIRKSLAGQSDNPEFEAALRGETMTPGMGPLINAARRLTADVPREGDLAGWIGRVMDPWEARAVVCVAEALESETLLAWVRGWTLLRAGLAVQRARMNDWDAGLFLVEWRAAGFDHAALSDLAFGDAASWPAAWRQLGLPNAADALGQPGATVRLAKMIDDRMTQTVLAARGAAFGPEVVFAFLWTLRIEAMNLRLALSASSAGIPEARIAPELRAEHG